MAMVSSLSGNSISTCTVNPNGNFVGRDVKGSNGKAQARSGNSVLGVFTEEGLQKGRDGLRKVEAGSLTKELAEKNSNKRPTEKALKAVMGQLKPVRDEPKPERQEAGVIKSAG